MLEVSQLVGVSLHQYMLCSCMSRVEIFKAICILLSTKVAKYPVCVGLPVGKRLAHLPILQLLSKVTSLFSTVHLTWQHTDT